MSESEIDRLTGEVIRLAETASSRIGAVEARVAELEAGPLASLWGAAPDITGGLSTQEYLDQVREAPALRDTTRWGVWVQGADGEWSLRAITGDPELCEQATPLYSQSRSMIRVTRLDIRGVGDDA